jgi:phosphoenolpyruvate phosphomutase
MIIARIESLILGKGVPEALSRAEKYISAGADGIMIHSRQRDGEDALEFIHNFRRNDSFTPLVVVPTAFNHIKGEEFWDLGVNIVIYANHLLRASYPAMLSVAQEILTEGKTQYLENRIMTMSEILSLIPGTDS